MYFHIICWVEFSGDATLNKGFVCLYMKILMKMFSTYDEGMKRDRRKVRLQASWGLPRIAQYLQPPMEYLVENSLILTKPRLESYYTFHIFCNEPEICMSIIYKEWEPRFFF